MVFTITVDGLALNGYVLGYLQAHGRPSSYHHSVKNSQVWRKFTTISDVHSSLIPNKITFTKYSLAQWTLKLHGSFNSLAPGRFEPNSGKVIFKLISVTDGWGTYYKIALR